MDAEMFPVFQATLLWRMWLMPAEGWAGFLTPRPRREKLCPPGPGRAGRWPRPLGWPGYFLWHIPSHPGASPGTSCGTYHPTQEPAAKRGTRQGWATPSPGICRAGVRVLPPAESETWRGRTLPQHVTRGVTSESRVSLHTCAPSVFDQPLLLCRKSGCRGSF